MSSILLEEKRWDLVHEYCFEKMWYSLTFWERVKIKFRFMTAPQYGIDEEDWKLSIEELEIALNDIKAPWWDKIATIIGI